MPLAELEKRGLDPSHPVMNVWIRRPDEHNPRGYIRKQGRNRIWLSGLSNKQAYFLEAGILERLAQTSKPGQCDQNHVQTLVKRDDRTLMWTSTWNGATLDNSTAQQELCRLSKDEVLRQAKCIDQMLAKANVTHLDMRLSGKNMAIHAGIVNLIDFDIAIIDGYVLSPVIRKYQTCRRYYNSKIRDTTPIWVPHKDRSTFWKEQCVTDHQLRCWSAQKLLGYLWDRACGFQLVKEYAGRLHRVCAP
jgi:hypothetical protein